MNVLTLQSRLKQSGRDPGPLDGVMGAKTLAALMQAMGATAARAAELSGPMVKAMREADIWTPARIQHFIAQMAHESGGFKFMRELGGPTYFARYDGRRDLGNVNPGDGARYHGRGIIQITGRANYREYGQALGLPLEDQPQLAETPDVAAKVAALYWKRRGINAHADADDIKRVTKAINGGMNGLEDRLSRLKAIRHLWGQA